MGKQKNKNPYLPVDVNVDGTTYKSDSPEYKDIYKSLLPMSDGAGGNLPTSVSSETAEVVGKAPDWLKNKRENEAAYKYLSSPEGERSMYQNLGANIAKPVFAVGNAVAEMTGVPGTVRFAKNPYENLKGTMNVLSDLSSPGGYMAMFGGGYSSDEEYQQAFNTLDAAGLIAGGIGLTKNAVSAVGGLSKAKKSVPFTTAERALIRENAYEYVNDPNNPLTEDLLTSYFDNIVAQKAPENANVRDYLDFIHNAPDGTPMATNTSEVMFDTFARDLPFLNPRNTQAFSEQDISRMLNTFEQNVPTTLPLRGNNRNNPYVSYYNTFANNRNGVGQLTYDYGDLSHLINTNTNTGNLTRTSALGNLSNFATNVPKKLGEYVNNANKKLGETFFPVKKFDFAEAEKVINEKLSKGLGIKNIDNPVNVSHVGNGKYKVFVDDANKGKVNTGYINFAKQQEPKQQTFTEALFGKKKDNRTLVYKPGDFPYQDDPSFQGTGVGAEVVDAFNKTLKESGGNLVSSTFHLEPGRKRYLHEFINDRMKKESGFSPELNDLLDKAKAEIGIGKKKEITADYLDKPENSKLMSLLLTPKWRYPMVAGAAATGAALGSQEAQGPSYRSGGKNPYIKTYAKGGEAETSTVEIERNERVYTPSGKMIMETPANAPTHEQGGVKVTLPNGSLVFPKKYFNALDAISGLPGFKKITDTMLDNAEKAYLSGEPYSSGGKRK